MCQDSAQYTIEFILVSLQYGSDEFGQDSPRYTSPKSTAGLYADPYYLGKLKYEGFLISGFEKFGFLFFFSIQMVMVRMLRKIHGREDQEHKHPSSRALTLLDTHLMVLHIYLSLPILHRPCMEFMIW